MHMALSSTSDMTKVHTFKSTGYDLIEKSTKYLSQRHWPVSTEQSLTLTDDGYFDFLQDIDGEITQMCITLLEVRYGCNTYNSKKTPLLQNHAYLMCVFFTQDRLSQGSVTCALYQNDVNHNK